MARQNEGHLGTIQHYVPQSYLRRFGIDGEPERIFAYEVGREPYKTNVKNVASQRDYYTFVDPDTNKKSDELEKAFGAIDDEGARLLGVLDTMTPGFIELGEEDRGNLLSYIAFMYTRNTRSKRQTREFHSQASLVQMQFAATNEEIFHRDAKKALGSKYNHKEAESARQALLDGKMNIEYNDDHQYFMGNALNMSRPLYEVLYRMKRIVLLENNTSHQFVTSDNPVSMYGPPGFDSSMGLGFVHAIFQLPISPKRCILLVNEDVELKDMDPQCSRDNVDHINWFTYHGAEKWVFSHVKSKTVSEMMNDHNSQDTGLVMSSPFGKLPPQNGN